MHGIFVFVMCFRGTGRVCVCVCVCVGGGGGGGGGGIFQRMRRVQRSELSLRCWNAWFLLLNDSGYFSNLFLFSFHGS